MSLLGFGNAGTSDYLCDPGKELAQNHYRLRRESVDLARKQFGIGYIDIRPNAGEQDGSTSTVVHTALHKSRDHLIAVPGEFSLVPGSVQKESK